MRSHVYIHLLFLSFHVFYLIQSYSVGYCRSCCGIVVPVRIEQLDINDNNAFYTLNDVSLGFVQNKRNLQNIYCISTALIVFCLLTTHI